MRPESDWLFAYFALGLQIDYFCINALILTSRCPLFALCRKIDPTFDPLDSFEPLVNALTTDGWTMSPYSPLPLVWNRRQDEELSASIEQHGLIIEQSIKECVHRGTNWSGHGWWLKVMKNNCGFCLYGHEAYPHHVKGYLFGDLRPTANRFTEIRTTTDQLVNKMSELSWMLETQIKQ